MHKLVHNTITVVVILIGIHVATFFADMYSWAEEPCVVGSLKQYNNAKKRATSLGSCYGWDESKQKYVVYTVEQCKNM